MGLFGSDAKNQPVTQADLAAEEDTAVGRTANALVGRLMDLGIDGSGPLDSSSQVVAAARKEHAGDDEKVIDEIVADHIKKAGVGGFVTGVGGLFTLPVALPANVLHFYTMATRMVAGIAEVRGYDVKDESTRSAILLSLVGADSSDILQKAGLSAASMTGSGRLANVALSRLPRAAAMMVNKAVGFRLLTGVGGKALARFVKVVPVAGGIVGAGLDGFMMKRLADHARREFPRRDTVVTPSPTA